MGEKPADDDKQDPSLELPSLSLPRFGRRKKKAQDEPGGDEPTASGDPATETPDPAQPVARHAAPASPPQREVDQVAQPEPVAQPDPEARVDQPGPPSPADPTSAAMGQHSTPPVAPPVAQPVTEPVTEPASEPLTQPMPPQTDDDATQPGRRAVTTTPAAVPAPGAGKPSFVDRVMGGHRKGEAGHDDAGQEQVPRQRRASRDFTLPPLAARVAAIVTGAVVGVFGVVLTYVLLLTCEGIRGTSSCGRPGFFLLLAVLALMVLLGAVLFKAWRQPDPGSTSLLAVGVVVVIALVVLIDVIFSPWMFVVVPIVSVGAFVLSHWVTTRFIEPAANPTRSEPNEVDIR